MALLNKANLLCAFATSLRRVKFHLSVSSNSKPKYLYAFTIFSFSNPRLVIARQDVLFLPCDQYSITFCDVKQHNASSSTKSRWLIDKCPAFSPTEHFLSFCDKPSTKIRNNSGESVQPCFNSTPAPLKTILSAPRPELLYSQPPRKYFESLATSCHSRQCLKVVSTIPHGILYRKLCGCLKSKYVSPNRLSSDRTTSFRTKT